MAAVQRPAPVRHRNFRIWHFQSTSILRLLGPNGGPEFFDYLYLAFTNAVAFSPTDVMPLARWAKLAMAVEAVASLIILGLVIARAVNILK